jgi:hypothetical protein
VSELVEFLGGVVLEEFLEFEGDSGEILLG